jgi:predicted Zn-dependent protease
MKVVVSSRRLYSKLARLGLAPLALVLVLGAATQSSCTTTPVTGRSQFNLLSLEDDTALGAQAYEEMLQGATLIKSGPQHDQVQRVVGKLVAVADADPQFQGQFDWEARLVKDDATVNAWCLPGGKMAVYTRPGRQVTVAARRQIRPQLLIVARNVGILPTRRR